MPKVPDNTIALVNRLPDPDERGFMSKVDADIVEDVVSQLRRGKRASLRSLVDMLVPPEEGSDFKARYAIHVWAVKTGHDGEQERRMFCRTLASELGGDRPKTVQEFLVQQIQLVGHEQVVGALGEVLLDEELCDPAAMALVAIRTGAAEQLRKALPDATGRVRLTILQSLGALGDTNALATLTRALGDENREVRLAAVWGLARAGSDESVPAVLKATDKSEGWERIQSVKACLLLAESLLAKGKRAEAKGVYSHLRRTCRDSETYIREVAQRAVTAMG